MMTYQVIPRKYRPQSFKEIVGQKSVVTLLKNALRSQKVAQAYIFCGSRGTGKTTLARLLAKALCCQNLQEEEEPCNQCASCVECSASHLIDVLEIDGASNRGIEDIRQLNETVGYAPASSKYKIYIIDEVHMLTKEAFNALLKTLEEPPPHVKFFLATTEPHKVLPTIMSRCQRLELGRISLEAMQTKLESVTQSLGATIDSAALHLIAQRGDGSLRDAESFLDQVLCHYPEGVITTERVESALGLISKQSLFELDDAISVGRIHFAFELSESLFSSGKDFCHFFESLLEHFRTLLLLKLHPDRASSKNTYSQKAELYSQEECLYILDFLMQWAPHITKTPFKKATLEAILLHLIRSKNRLSIDVLTRRLIDLEKSLSKAPLLTSTPLPPTSPLTAMIPPPQEIHPNNLKNREFGKVDALHLDQALESEESTPVNTQTPSNGVSKAEISAQAKTDCLGIPASPSKATQKHETLLRFAAVELEGILKKES